jgi:GNAT superfamily N-acetyltransferase
MTSTTRITVEPIPPERAGEVSEMAFPLFREVYKDTQSEIVEEFLQKTQTPESIAEQIRSGTVYLFIRYDGEIAGYLAYEFDDEGLRLSKLYLLPAFRGKGIGGYLLGYVEERARENGSGMIHLEVNEVNPHAREFYRLHGFVPGERLDYRRIVMRKQLS